MKDTYYFSHDYNARADEKIIKLLKVMKWEGYGLFWALVEKLYEAGGEVEADMDCIAYDLRTESDRIKKLCEDFELFYQKAGKLRSLSVDRRLEHRAKKSEKARESAFSRWGNANALRPYMKRNAIKERKGKEKKEEEKKEDISPTPLKAGAEPKEETAIQFIVRQYKKALSVPENDKEWDKARFPRLVRPAAAIIACFQGDEEYATAWASRTIARWKDWAVKNNKSFTLERIAQDAQDAKGKYLELKTQEEKENGYSHNATEMGFNNSNKRSHPTGMAHIGEIAPGAIKKVGTGN